MKKINSMQMEAVNGGATPTKTQIACYVMSVAYGFVNPFLGIFAGGVCLFAD
jgi:hypothetical protein